MKKSLFLIATAIVFITFLTACSSSKMASNGCSMNRGFVGYGKH